MFAVTPWTTKRTVPVPTLPVDPMYPPFFGPLGEEFGHLIQRFFRGPPEFGPPPAVRHWGLEVTEEEEAIVVRAEAPGFEPEDFEILVTEDQLVLRAAMTIEPGGKGGKIPMYARKEYYETIPLPVGINPAQVIAKYINGVLTVTLPRSEKVKARKVPVTPGV